VKLPATLKNWPAHYTALAGVVLLQLFLVFVPLDPLTTPPWLAKVFDMLQRVNAVQIGAVLGYWVQRQFLGNLRAAAKAPGATWPVIMEHEYMRVFFVVGVTIAYCIYG
jgi:hypothetical protein